MAKIIQHLLHNTALTTMLQSADTARFQDDKVADRITDVSHARAEVLSALLFGYEIIIPAGAVADCPALVEVLPEVMKEADPYLERIKELTKSSYRLFRVGLEQQYRSQDGKSGYSAYVQDYLNHHLSPDKRLVVLREMGKKKEWNQNKRLQVMKLGESYLKRDWEGIDQLGKDLYQETGDERHLHEMANYRNYCMMVDKHLDSGPITEEPVYSDQNFMSNATKFLYLKNIQELYKLVRERDLIASVASKELQLITDVFEEQLKKNQNPAERGSWYVYEKRFRDEGMWDYLRNWLDIILFDRLHRGFGIHLPSYFTQELERGSNNIGLTMAVMSESSFQSLEQKTSTDLIKPEYPGELDIDWKGIWDVVSRERFRDSVDLMHTRVIRALQDQYERERQLSENEKHSAEDKAEMLLQIRKQRREAMLAAFDKHLAFLNEELINFNLKMKNGKVVVGKKIKVSPKKGVKVATKLVSLGGADAIVDTIEDFTGVDIYDKIVDAGIEVAGGISERLVDSFSRAHTPTETSVVARPNNTIKDRKSFLKAERDRINLWASL